MLTTKLSRVALALFVSASALAVGCGDDDDDNNGTGGSKHGGSSGKSGGAGKAGAGAGRAGGGAGGTAGTAGTASGTAGISGGGMAAQAGSSGAGAGTAGTPAGGMAGTLVAGSAGVAGLGGSAGTVAQGGEGGEVSGAGGEGGTTEQPVTGKYHLYVGCADSSGTLQSYLVDGGTLSPLGTVVAGGAISNSTFNVAGDRMYVAHTISATETRITTYTRDRTTGGLTLLGTPANVPMTAGAGGTGGAGSGGAGGKAGAAGAGGAAPTVAGPQTLVLDAGEDYLAVPNYYVGNVYVYDVATNGTVGALVAADAGGTNGHDAVFSKNNNYMLVPYLGSNYIKVYDFNDATGAISLLGQTTLPVAMSGPRHLALHPNGNWLYSINETAGGTGTPAGSLDLFDFDQTNGALTSVHTYDVPLPSGYTGAKNGAEIVIAPSSNFLYVSMRLDNAATGSIVAYSIGAAGALTFVEQYASRGITPRQFSLSSDGKLLIVGNQNSDNIALFSVDTSTGKLTFVTQRDVCDSPRFSRFADIQ